MTTACTLCIFLRSVFTFFCPSSLQKRVNLLYLPLCIFYFSFWPNSSCEFSTVFGPIWPLHYLEDLLGRFWIFLFSGLLQGGEGLGFSSPPPPQTAVVAACLFCGSAFLCGIFLVSSGQMPLSSAGTMSQIKAAWPWFAWRWAQLTYPASRQDSLAQSWCPSQPAVMHFLSTLERRQSNLTCACNFLRTSFRVHSSSFFLVVAWLFSFLMERTARQLLYVWFRPWS